MCCAGFAPNIRLCIQDIKSISLPKCLQFYFSAFLFCTGFLLFTLSFKLVMCRNYNVVDPSSMLQTFLVPFPRSVPPHNPVYELYGQFLQPQASFFSNMPCQLWDLLQTGVPLQIMSNQLNLPQEKHLKDDQWKLEHNFESHSKGSEYLRYFCFLFVIHLQT